MRELNTPARAARKAAGMTLETAAKRARVSPRYLAAREVSGPPVVLIRRLATVYGCSLDDFVRLREGVVGYRR
ncbi:MAG: helix-turn-helix transcriptional regulator [Armatimonadetes bacterium]|nr:helix-turn-helix transcriptional regulator [Armatimonadota bacterium]